MRINIKLLSILLLLFFLPILGYSSLILRESRVVEDLFVKEEFSQVLKISHQSYGDAIRNKNIESAILDLYTICRVYTALADEDSLSKYASFSLDLSKKTDDNEALAYTYLSQALLYDFLNEYNKCVENCQNALGLLENSNNYFLLARINKTLFGVYTVWDDIPEMEKYATATLDNAQKANDLDLIANGHFALSVVYEYKYRRYKSEKDKELSLQTMELIQKMYLKNPNKISIRLYVLTKLNLANFFFNYYSDDKKYIRIIEENAKEVLTLTQKLKTRIVEYQASAYGLLSECAMLKKDTQSQEKYLLKVNEILRDVSLPHYYLKNMVLMKLSLLYEQEGDMKQALYYANERSTVLQANSAEEKKRNIKKMEIQFETKKKEQQIRYLKAQAVQGSIMRYLLISLVVLVVIVLVFTVRSYRFKMMYLKASEAKLLGEKREQEILLESQRVLEQQRIKELEQKSAIEKAQMSMQAETEERRRIAKEIHDDIGPSVTSLNLAANMISDNTVDSEIKQFADIITTNTSLLHRQMNEIVWSLNSNNDYLESLISFMKQFAVSFLDKTDIALNFQSAIDYSDILIEGYKRRNIYHAFKEIINNAVKYSKGSEIDVLIVNKNKLLTIVIHDNGVGLPPKETIVYGYGLRNVQHNIEGCGGAINFTNENGLKATIFVPLDSNIPT